MPSEVAEALWPGLGPFLHREARDRGRDGIPVLVGVDGRSGSGKTDLARWLAGAVEGLGLSCGVVHLDDLYPGWAGLAAALEPLCAQVVTPLRQGRDGGYTSWDWHRSRPGPHRSVPADRVVVLEGVGVLASGCAANLDLRLWLEAPGAVRRERALARDGDIFAPHWQEWAAQEDEIFPTGPPAGADVVVDTVTGSVRWDRLTP